MDQWELSKDGELEGQWRIRREEVGGKEQQVKRHKKLTDENPVNEGLDVYKSTHEFRMIASVF